MAMKRGDGVHEGKNSPQNQKKVSRRKKCETRDFAKIELSNRFRRSDNLEEPVRLAHTMLRC